MNDLISRQAAIDAFGLSEKTRKYGGDHSGYDTRMLYEIQDVLEGLPSAQPETHGKRTETHACDCISREAAIEALRDEFKRTPTNAIRAMDTIKNLPSAQPELDKNTMPEQSKMDKFGVKTGETCTDTISRQAAIDAAKDWYVGLICGSFRDLEKRLKSLPPAQPDRSLWFRIGEICVDESKGFISSGRAVEKIRELLREAERWEE